MKTLRSNLLTALLLFTCLTGCAVIRQNDAPMKEQTLEAAGFKVRPVNTAKRQADLASLTPYRIQMRTNSKGKTIYLYADPKKNVIYAGGPKEYATYKKTVVQQDMVAQQKLSDTEWEYWAATYGEGFAGNPGYLH